MFTVQAKSAYKSEIVDKNAVAFLTVKVIKMYRFRSNALELCNVSVYGVCILCYRYLPVLHLLFMVMMTSRKPWHCLCLVETPKTQVMWLYLFYCAWLLYADNSS